MPRYNDWRRAAAAINREHGQTVIMRNFVKINLPAACLSVAFLTLALAPAPGSSLHAQEATGEVVENDAWGGIRTFAADLAAGNQTTYTESDGEGSARITFNIGTMEIEWEVVYDKLTSAPTGIHLHGPAQPGTNAVAIVDLGTNGLESPITGKARIPDGYAQYMLLGWSYVLLKTDRYPEGELRGKLDTTPPPGYLEKSARWGRGDTE